MWFQRMQLEVWFDEWQFKTTHDIGESAVKFLAVKDLQLDLADVGLRYGHHAGGPELRAAIADWHGVGAADVCVVGGASEANFCVVSALVKPGDHVIVEHPNYPSLYEVLEGAEGAWMVHGGRIGGCMEHIICTSSMYGMHIEAGGIGWGKRKLCVPVGCCMWQHAKNNEE